MYMRMERYSVGSNNASVTVKYVNYENETQAGLVADILDKTEGLTAEFLRVFSEKQLRQYLARLI